ncbi:hypothetical protein DY000_02036750 [Brassica cretica]|uniref:Uncharacterized protein n=1 Tax=Brassica cretica TaxID=69181 RepID=A0ABQ7BKA2_BRACR|nr:hypothetical protein DY000_02036750 [Brassica cretica]
MNSVHHCNTGPIPRGGLPPVVEHADDGDHEQGLPQAPLPPVEHALQLIGQELVINGIDVVVGYDFIAAEEGVEDQVINAGGTATGAFNHMPENDNLWGP